MTTRNRFNIKASAFTLTTSQISTLIIKLMGMDACWPTDFNKKWNALRAKEEILVDVVYDGLFTVMPLNTRKSIVQNILENLHPEADMVEVLDWMTDSVEEPPKAVLAQLKTNPPSELVALRISAYNKVMEKVAKLDEGEPNTVKVKPQAKGKSVTPKTTKVKSVGPQTEVKSKSTVVPIRSAALKVDQALADVKTRLKTLNDLEPELSLQAYTGRLNNDVVWPVLNAVGVKKADNKSTPKREELDGQVKITYFTAPTKVKDETKILKALGDALGPMYGGGGVNPKSVTVFFSSFPAA